MKCEICGAPATVHICELDGSGGSKNRSFCAAHAQEHFDFPIPSEAEVAQWQDDRPPLAPDNPHIARLLDLIIEGAYRLDSPRIELEVTESGTIVQYEMDGDLVEQDSLIPAVYAALLALIKQLENLHILQLGDGRRIKIEYRSDGGVTLYPY